MVYIFCGLKRKIKNEETLKVQIWFKIELVYSIWKPLIRKFNFSNSLNVQRSSWNVKLDGYKEIFFYTFNVIKLVLFWHKLCYKIHFFIFWKCMLSMISGFLFMVTVNRCFLLFSYNKLIKHRTTKAQSRRYRHFKHVYFNFVFCKICFLNNCFETGD